MPVLSRQNAESAAIAENTNNLLSEGSDNKDQCTIIALALRKIASLPRVRKDKVLAVRKQLAEGIYDLDQRLDAVLDSLLAAIVT
jgi:hypothetical protein